MRAAGSRAIAPIAIARRMVARFRIEILLIVLLGALAFGPRMKSAPLVDWDEATYAQVAHEAIASGNYLDLTWNGALSFKTLGESEFAARLPSVLMGIGTLVLICLSVSLAAGRLAGLFAAL